MPHQIILCILHLCIWCITIFLLIAIVSFIKSKLNIFVIIFYFLFSKFMHQILGIFLKNLIHQFIIFPYPYRTNSASLSLQNFFLPFSPKFQISSSLSLQTRKSSQYHHFQVILSQFSSSTC